MPDDRPLRVIICGGRDWKDGERIGRRIRELPPDCIIVHGACPTGADAFADFYAGKGRVVRHPAEWDKYGKRAGPLRNQAMADAGADLCIAFPTKRSRGTWDMVERARKAGIPVEVIDA